MLPSAGPQYKDVLDNRAIGDLAAKGAEKLAKGMKTARKVQGQYVTGKYRQIRKNVLELKGIEQEREARGITSFGDPETGAVFPLKTEALMNQPGKTPRRATSAPTNAGASTSRAQMSRRASSAPTNATTKGK